MLGGVINLNYKGSVKVKIGSGGVGVLVIRRRLFVIF